MKVLKFGGSSIKDAECIVKVIDIVKQTHQKNNCIVVVSALGGVTDQLIEISHIASKGGDFNDLFIQLVKRYVDIIETLIEGSLYEKCKQEVEKIIKTLFDVYTGIRLIREVSDKTLAYISGFGERLAAYIISYIFTSKGIETTYLDARKLILTNNNYLNAQVDFEKTNKNIINYFFGKEKTLHIITGFIAKNEENYTTTLGRGGSDYTAAIFAAALNASILEIWSDVNGVMTADPNKVKQSFSLEQISYNEAMELSYFGAKVLYPLCLRPVYKKNIPILVKNTFKSDFKGTLIKRDILHNERPVKGISSLNHCSLFVLPGVGITHASQITHRIFYALSHQDIEILLMVQSSFEYSITFVTHSKYDKIVKKILEEEFRKELQTQQIDKILTQKDLSLIAIVGDGMKNNSGICGTLFRTMGSAGVNILAISQGASESNISFIIPTKHEVKVSNLIHEAFFLSNYRVLHLYLIGVGTVGKTLLQQIAKEIKNLRQELKIDIRFMGIANSKKIIMTKDSSNPIDINHWEENLEKGLSTDINYFLEQAIEYNLRNSVLIDCTANKKVSDCYLPALQKGISIVTANKIAASGDLETYRQIKKITQKKGVKFFNETNVGAGLPIIQTLHNLIESGDRVYKIQAILSGTINYILENTFMGKTFSEALIEAQKRGFTEPDPRIDVSGIDIGRKILILAREMKLDLNLEDVLVESLVPKSYLDEGSIEDFHKKLKQYDPIFAEKIPKNKDKKIGYIATLENKKAKVKLEIIDRDHPFFELKGNDNIILFTTERYMENPLIIKGPGAGAIVTAAGVFSDIIRVIN